MDEFDDHELDATVMFKQEASALTSVQNLEDALSRFGFSLDDRISHRELVMIYKQIKNAMEGEIFRLANSTAYAEAKEMRSRLTNLRQEFDNLQIKGVENVRTEQNEIFSKASSEIIGNLKKQHNVAVEDLEKYIDDQWNQHSLFQSIENEKLEQAISKIPRPNMRYSKRMIELFKSEYNLNRQKEYDEAIKVRRMIDNILPKEEEKFFKQFDDMIEKKRQTLRKNQKFDTDRMEEKLKKAHWTDVRKRELESKITSQRIINNTKDMEHTHRMEAKLKPEMSVKPSALWQHRQGYNATSSALRGQQMLDSIRGKQEGVHVYAESLVDKHDFGDVPQDTTTFYVSKHQW